MNNIDNLLEYLRELKKYYKNKGDNYIQECKLTEDNIIYSQLESKAMMYYGISEGIYKAIRIIKSFE